MNFIFHADIFAFVDFQMFCFVSFRKGFFCRLAQSGKNLCVLQQNMVTCKLRMVLLLVMVVMKDMVLLVKMIVETTIDDKVDWHLDSRVGPKVAEI